jgi:serine/threonine-protein kinase
MQDVVSKRIADALRVELTDLEHRWRASAPAMELYLRARKLLDTTQWNGAPEATELLARCLELSPELGPAMAAHANAAVKAWWVDIVGQRGRDWRTIAGDSVERALRHADDLAETHLAAAMLALQIGDLPRMANELATALGIAPGLVEAQRYLAELQCEAGRTREGLKRAQLVLELDPTMHNARFAVARHLALGGDRAGAEAQCQRVADEAGELNGAVVIMRARLMLWFGDVEGLRTCVGRLAESRMPVHALVVGFCRYALGDEEKDVIDRSFALARAFGNSRMLSLVGQYATEVHAYRGDLDAAFERLAQAAGESLVDTDWLARCPVLEPLRADPRFAPIAIVVQSRAAAIWALRNPDTL